MEGFASIDRFTVATEAFDRTFFWDEPVLAFDLASLDVIEIPGDYNGSGIVDGDDYLVWRSEFDSRFSWNSRTGGKEVYTSLDVERINEENNGLISTPRDAQDGHNLEAEFPDILGLELTRDIYKSDRLEERDASLFEAAKTMVLEKDAGGWLTLTF